MLELINESNSHIFDELAKDYETYKYDDTKLLEVSRIALDGLKIYSESYEYDSSDDLLYKNLISTLGQILYEKDLSRTTDITK